jgi:protein TonB
MEMANDKLSRFIGMSAVLHGGLFAAVVLAPKLFPNQPVTNWGTSTNQGIKVGYTSSLPGIPLPSPPVVNENAKGNDSDTLNPVEAVAPKPVEKVPSEAEIKIPSTTTKKPEPKPTAPTKVARGKPEPEPAPPSNAIPGNASGQVPLPYGSQAGSGTSATFGDGNFGTRFPEYVRSMINAIDRQWQKPAGVPFGSRVYVTFTIGKRGEVSDVEVQQTSNSVPLDSSAKRAVLAASPLPSLPPAYSGSSIDVRFYFENSR